MPDDPLAAAAPTPEVPTPPVADPPSPGNGAGQVPGLTAEAVTQMVAEATRPFESRIEALQRENRELQERVQSTSQPAPRAPEDDGDFFSRFTTDPEAALRSVVQDEQKQLAPLLATMLDTQHQNLVTNHRLNLDARYGEGTWEEVFRPVLDEVFTNARKQNPTLLASPDFVEGEVLKLRGFHEEALIERRQKAIEAQENTRRTGMDEISKHVLNATNLTGGIRPAKSGRELTQEEKAYVAHRAEHGRSIDEASLQRNLSLVGRGVSFDDWKAMQPKEKGA
jgi:hypothetical protein